MIVKNNYNECITNLACSITAATTSISTGLNPVEHGWLGWNMYIKPINETITLFRNCKKGNEGIINDEFLKVKNKLVQKKITDEINEYTDFAAVEISPYGKTTYDTLEEMCEIIKDECQKDGRKYIYAYDTEPDHTMHEYGPDANIVKAKIKLRNDMIETLCNDIEDSVVIIIADHGHRLSDPIYFEEEYPKLMKLLERTTSLEQRAVSFKIKEGCQELFKKEFNKKLGKDFTLYTKQEIIDSKLFGDGEENELFRDAIGDFIAIAENSNKSILTSGDKNHLSKHAGYSDDEIYIPLIVIDRC